jgi:hypothetical protein
LFVFKKRRRGKEGLKEERERRWEDANTTRQEFS